MEFCYYNIDTLRVKMEATKLRRETILQEVNDQQDDDDQKYDGSEVDDVTEDFMKAYQKW